MPWGHKWHWNVCQEKFDRFEIFEYSMYMCVCVCLCIDVALKMGHISFISYYHRYWTDTYVCTVHVLEILCLLLFWQWPLRMFFFLSLSHFINRCRSHTFYMSLSHMEFMVCLFCFCEFWLVVYPWQISNEPIHFITSTSIAAAAASAPLPTTTNEQNRIRKTWVECLLLCWYEGRRELKWKLANWFRYDLLCKSVRGCLYTCYNASVCDCVQ